MMPHEGLEHVKFSDSRQFLDVDMYRELDYKHTVVVICLPALNVLLFFAVSRIVYIPQFSNRDSACGIMTRLRPRRSRNCSIPGKGSRFLRLALQPIQYPTQKVMAAFRGGNSFRAWSWLTISIFTTLNRNNAQCSFLDTYIITLNVATCFNPQGIIIRDQVSNNIVSNFISYLLHIVTHGFTQFHWILVSCWWSLVDRNM
jgi:hypothetical protein